jgi:hypothetical protein
VINVQSLPVTFKTRLGSGLFLAAGISLLPLSPLLAWLSIVFFGLGVVVFAIGLHPGSTYLKLSAEGFLFASLFRKHFVPWSSVDSFFPVRMRSHKMVGWNYVGEFQASRTLRRINTLAAGAEAALPDSYGMSVEELCALLNELHSKYGKRAH